MYEKTDCACAGLPMHSAVMFMNSNKSEGNIQEIIRENRQKCDMAGIGVGFFELSTMQYHMS